MFMQETATLPETTLADVSRDRIAGSTCDIWDLVAPGLPCPACDDRFEDRLERATQLAG